MKLYIDYSTLTLWRLCPQKFRFNSQMNLMGGNTDALNFGSLIHYATELLGVENKKAPLVLPSDEAIHQEIEALCDKQPPDVRNVTDPFLRILHMIASEASQYVLYNLMPDERRSLRHALKLTVAYAKKYTPETLKYTDFEKKFEVKLGKTANGHEVFYRGTIDGVLENGILERKTTYDLNAFLNLLSPNYQAVGYVWAARELTGNKTINRVVFDGIGTKGYGKSPGAATSNQSRWTINTAPETLFLRAETVVSEMQIENWKAQTLKDADRLIEDCQAADVTRNAPSACQAYNTSCSYKAICMSTSKAIETALVNNYTKQTDIWDGYLLTE